MSVDIFFRSIDCKPPTGDVADMGILMMSLIYDIATIDKLRVAAVAYVIGGIYDVIELEWSRGHSDYLADPISIL